MAARASKHLICVVIYIYHCIVLYHLVTALLRLILLMLWLCWTFCLAKNLLFAERSLLPICCLLLRTCLEMTRDIPSSQLRLELRNSTDSSWGFDESLSCSLLYLLCFAGFTSPKIVGWKENFKMKYLESDKVGWNWSPWKLHWDESDWLTDVLMMDGWRTPLQWLAQTRGQSTRMPVSISVYCDIHNFHAMPIPAAMLLGSAWLGREVAAIDGKSLSGCQEWGYVRIAQHSDIFWHIFWPFVTVTFAGSVLLLPLCGASTLYGHKDATIVGGLLRQLGCFVTRKYLATLPYFTSGSFRRSQLFLNHIFHDSRSQQLRLCQVNSEGSTHVKRPQAPTKARVSTAMCV